MGWWRVMLRSEGWRLERDTGEGPQGFFVTRCVEASGMEAAADAAKAEVLRDLDGLAVPDGDDPPLLQAVKIVSVPDRETRSGFVFYALTGEVTAPGGDPTFRMGPSERPTPFLQRLRKRLRPPDR